MPLSFFISTTRRYDFMPARLSSAVRLSMPAAAMSLRPGRTVAFSPEAPIQINEHVGSYEKTRRQHGDDQLIRLICFRKASLQKQIYGAPKAAGKTFLAREIASVFKWDQPLQKSIYKYGKINGVSYFAKNLPIH